MVSMNRLSTEKRAQVIGSLVEGNSIRATVRMTGVAKNTHAVALHYMHYNFARVHTSLTITNDDGTKTKRTPGDGRRGR